MKVKFGAIVTDGVGKLGGHQFQRGRYTAHLNTKRSGQAKRSRKPTAQNRYFAQVASFWRSLPASDKDTWSEWAASGVGYDDPFGNEAYFNPFQLYLSQNLPLAMTDQALLTEAIGSSIAEMPSFKTLEDTITISTGIKDYGTNGGVEYTQMIVRAAYYRKGGFPKSFLRKKRMTVRDRSSNLTALLIDFNELMPPTLRKVGDVVELRLSYVPTTGGLFSNTPPKIVTVVSD